LWGFRPTPQTPKSTIPNPQSPFLLENKFNKNKKIIKINKI